MELGKVKYIKDVREIWENEAKDFTPWLASNLDLLGDELGYDFELIASENNVGNFSLDILAKEVGTDNYVAIENQLEITDHSHLGQLITYASGVDAKIAIWIAKEIREEHRKAVDWLNENTGDDIQFFAVEVQAIKINDSLPAPIFKIKASPNSWVKSHNVRNAIQDKKITEKQQFYHEFFMNLLERVKEKCPNLTNAKTVGYDSWKGYPAGKTGFEYLTSFRSGNKISVELYIDTGDKLKNEELFDSIIEKRNQIESELGPLSWERLDGKRACRIAAYINTPIEDEKKFEWFVETLDKFTKVFKKYI